MELRLIHDRHALFEFLKNNSRFDYIYQFYDLEEKNWQNTICYGLFVGKELKQIAIIAINYGIPVLLAASYDETEYSIELLKCLKNFLPKKFYTHMDKVSLNNVFCEDKIHDAEDYINMGLDKNVAFSIPAYVVKLGYEHIKDINELLSVSYPEAWLDDELVKLGKNFGIYKNNKLISFAGIHAYSKEFQVAAISHVTTHPDFRRQGYGENVVAALIQELKSEIKYIGLNVKANNLTAINCYKKLGFREYGRFIACEIELLNKA